MAGSGAHRVLAVVEYDGTEFLGFQIQHTGRTVQGEIEHALAELTGRHVRIVGAGRTDSGVHAKGQVIHFSVVWDHPLLDLRRALNAVLPADVAVAELRGAPPGFHARYSARSREYVYTIYNGALRSPLVQRYAFHVSSPLDAAAMNRACAGLVGEHDFMAFGWSPRSDGRGQVPASEAADRPSTGRGTVRRVLQAACRREGCFVCVDVVADAFLRRMVRRIVGNLLLVGTGELGIEQFSGLLKLRHRRTPGVAAPGHGLCLVKVNY